MDAIEFILMLAGFAVVLFWYVANEAGDAQGGAGLLAFIDPPAKARARRYRMRARAAPMRGASPDRRTEAGASAYRRRAETGRPRYRSREDIRYRVKDKASLYRAAAEN